MTTALHIEQDAGFPEGDAAIVLAEAAGMQGRLHLPGGRDRYRAVLERGISLAERALEQSNDARLIVKVRKMLVRAHAARAEDARYGAGQLSRGSQRAPTPEDCDDGWLRVEEIVTNAESSAVRARVLAEALDTPAGRRYAQAAEVSARAARQIVLDRNHAYTFHTDPGFSFGEGWYLAAAAVLKGVSVQINPDTAQALQAERFLRDAGLGRCLAPYRPRPRSNKPLTAIVADAFRPDPVAAQRAVRAAFLGSEPPSPFLVEWTRRQVGDISSKKILLWVRTCVHDAPRNTDFEELARLSTLVCSLGLIPIFFGDALPAGIAPTDAVDLTLAWKKDLFQGPDMRRAQLQFFEELKQNHGLVGQLGVTTAGMDGPALTGLSTLYLTQTSNVRMRKWVGVIPGYREVVRKEGYLDVIEDALGEWIENAGR